MAVLELYTSNRLEILAEALAAVVAPPMVPMMPETILVQSGGMQRWISIQLAMRHGICANTIFPFPVAFAYELCRRILPGIPKEYRLSKEKMLWNILRVLDQERDNPDFAPLAAFATAGSTLKKVQLAERIAFHFDQYLLFRPEWAPQWEAGLASNAFRTERNQASEHWQSVLWRCIAAGHESEHRAALLLHAITALNTRTDLTRLPERISIFGIPTLPPIYLDLLKALSNHADVRIFLLSPCRQYWGDLCSFSDRQRAYRKQNSGPIEEEREEDTTPLAGFGQTGRDFHELLLERDITASHELYSDIVPTTLLRQVQADLLDLQLDPTGQYKPDFADNSIQVHCCHSPLREMEILRDLIHDILQNNPDILPRDILIMNPDMDAYAPFIQAIFGTSDDPDQHIPFSIADRRPSKSAMAARLFLELLDFGQYRFEASRVSALIENPLVRARLQLDEDETSKILEWIRAAGIRWGFDGTFRRSYGLSYSQNTWASGLARLYLGYMTGEHAPVQGIAPLVPGGAAEYELLGRLTAWLDDLHKLWTHLQQECSAPAWQDLFLWMLDTFFPKDRSMDEPGLQIRKATGELTTNMDDFVADGATMRHLVRKSLDETAAESGFLAAGLTFCGLKPMRSIPFRIICLTGLNSTAFPRQDQTPGFDLMAARPRRGDRSLRDDDRYLFLESLISTRDRLILTYPGLSQKDNSEAPPSVLVAELLDYLDHRCTVAGNTPSQQLVVRHRLQAFHPDYFTPGSRIFSYSGQNHAAAQALFQPAHNPEVFAGPMPSPNTLDTISLDDLVRFFGNPSKHLLSRLRIFPPRPEDAFQDEEPLQTPQGLDAYAPMQQLLESVLADPDLPCEELLSSWQLLPPGQAGLETAHLLIGTVRRLGEQVRALTQGKAAHPVDLEVTLQDMRLSGRVAVYGQIQLAFRPAGIKAKDMLALWIRHLALHAAGFDFTSVHCGKDTSFSFALPEAPRQNLETLIALFTRGQTLPLPFFAQTALAYAQKIHAGKSEDDALSAAQASWTGSSFMNGEKDDPHVKLLYRDQEPDWGQFAELARAIYLPLLRGMT